MGKAEIDIPEGYEVDFVGEKVSSSPNCDFIRVHLKPKKKELEEVLRCATYAKGDKLLPYWEHDKHIRWDRLAKEAKQWFIGRCYEADTKYRKLYGSPKGTFLNIEEIKQAIGYED